MELLKAVFFGIIEGITEWLPVSSTGHMILFDEFVQLSLSEEFKDMFLVVIQLGAILAVVVLFWKEIWPFTTLEKGVLRTDKISMWCKIVIACIPAAILELCFGDWIESVFYNYQTVAIMLIAVGILFIFLENRNHRREASITVIDDITFQNAFLIGIFQLAAAVFPGTSRSGATILGGLFLGLSRTVAAEFTFYLAIPVMFGASLIKMIKFGAVYSPLEVQVLLIGTVTAFIVSFFAIKFLMGYIKKHDFKIFGWYRIGLGMIVLLYFAFA